MLGAVARPFKRAGWAKDTAAPEGQLWLEAPRRPGRWGTSPARLMMDYSRGQAQLVTFDETGQLTRHMTFAPVDADTWEAVAAFLTAQAQQAGARVA
jgi:hypothetical protein